ncbi:MAG: hypothetical protein LBH18_07420 [Spirochaetaceae bacterium]|jgi:histidinol dehydrogenase|nr:hypothetical protein [Spirochaetaceae bacterium]
MGGAAEIEGTDARRSREEGLIVYPVYSRRAGGLSIGINLYPDKKHCNFNCRYCEVFPFASDVRFSPELMEGALRKAAAYALSRGMAVKDICFSGNGEPTLSPAFPVALRRASALRDSLFAGSDIVVISNGTGLLREDCFNLLQDAVRLPVALKLWLKLDAGSADWYRRIDDGAVDFEALVGVVKEFSRRGDCVIQTMHCSVDGEAPSDDELRAWAALVTEIAKGGNTHLVQIYGKARPSPHDPVCSDLPLASLEGRAALLRAAFERAGVAVPVAVYK